MTTALLLLISIVNQLDCPPRELTFDDYLDDDDIELVDCDADDFSC